MHPTKSTVKIPPNAESIVAQIREKAPILSLSQILQALAAIGAEKLSGLSVDDAVSHIIKNGGR